MRWLATLVLLAPLSASAGFAPFRLNTISGGACTDGVDCLCDTIDVSPSTLLLCQDWEAAPFYEYASNSWQAGNGSPFNRGVDSLWTTLYGNGDGDLFNSSDGTPNIGTACGFGGAGCSGNSEYCSSAQGALTPYGSADCWGPNVNTKARLDFQRSGDFDAEVGTLTLTGGTGASSDVGAGNTHMAYRIKGGAGNHAGIVGAASWTRTSDFGLTELIAYASNVESSGVADWPWKHDEFGDYPYSESFPIGDTGYDANFSTTFPFNSFFWGDLGCNDSDYTEAACDSALASSGPNIGNFDCTSAGLIYGPTYGTGTNEYSQADDWPLGTWGCVSAHIAGMGTTNMEYKVWFNGELIVHLQNFNFNAANICNDGYDAVVWNAYANANQGLGETPTTATTYRYQDNMVFTNGAPPSCADIGFTVP